MMRFYAALLLSLWTGCSGSGSCMAVAAVETALPSLRLVCKEVSVLRNESEPFQSRDWSMKMEWKLENASSWDIAWCEGDKARVVAEDPEGRRSADRSYFYHHIWGSNREGRLSISFERWRPGAGAQWVRVKGKVLFAVSRHEAATAPVTVKLVDGCSVPLVLKGAGLAGDEDIKATLTVEKFEEYGDGRWANMKLGLKTNRPLGFRTFELRTMDGKPLKSVGFNESFTDLGKGLQVWGQERKMDAVPERELQVLVKYAAHPQLAWATVDSRATLSGVGDVGNERKISTEGAKPCSGNIGPRGGAVPSSVASAPDGAGRERVRAELCGISIGSRDEWDDGAYHETPEQFHFDTWLVVDKSFVFNMNSGVGEQSLEVTDSTGRVLSPAIFDLSKLWLQQTGREGIYVQVQGKSAALPSPGAEWVRLKGAFRVPVSKMGASPVYELPLKKGAKLDIPVPGESEAVECDGDVANAGAARTCQLSLDKLTWKTDREAELEVNLLVEGMPFDFDEFELLDAEGKPLDASRHGGGGGSGNNSRSWHSVYRVDNAGDMKLLRVRLKYRAGMDMENVPVDVTFDLSGSIPRKESAVNKVARNPADSY